MNSLRSKVLAGVVVVLTIAVMAQMVLRSGGSGTDAVTEDTKGKASLREIGRTERGAGAGGVGQLAGEADSGDVATARSALLALGRIGTPEAFDVIRARLQGDGRPEVRAAAAAALGHSRADRELLETTCRNDPETMVRAAAARGLTRQSSPEHPEALPTLISALRDPEPLVRKEAIRGFNRVSGVRYLFNPEAPPEQQADMLNFMEAAMRERGLMKSGQ